MAMSAEYNEGHARGLQAGWDDTNYATAYEGAYSGDVFGRAEKALAARVSGETSNHFRSGWHTGYADGTERFENDQYPDGSPISDD